MPSLLSLISNPLKTGKTFVLLQSTATQTCIPVLREIVEKSLGSSRPIYLFCFLHPPSFLLNVEYQELPNLRVFDWTSSIPGYDDDYLNTQSAIQKILGGPAETPADVMIDSLDTLLSNLGSQSRAYQVLSAILEAPATARLVAHILVPCPLLPLLTDTRFSSSLVYIRSHHPSIISHISTAYLTLPPPQSPPEKFWNIFLPLSERHYECEALVYGADGEGTGSDEIVAELIVRNAGGGGRRRGVERSLEGWISSSSVACDLQDLVSLKPLWKKKVTEDDAPDPTKNVSFNLNLTAEQQQLRAMVPLPYAHEGNVPSPATPAAILYDPDSADDIDDDDPDEDLDL